MKLGRTVTAWINGRKVMTFTGALLDTPGAIGVYCEDSRVRVQNVRLIPLARPTASPFPAGQPARPAK